MDIKNWENKYEYDIIEEPNYETQPSLSMDNSGWDSLKDVPFAGSDSDDTGDSSDVSWDSLGDVPFGGDVLSSSEISEGGDSAISFDALDSGDL